MRLRLLVLVVAPLLIATEACGGGSGPGGGGPAPTATLPPPAAVGERLELNNATFLTVFGAELPPARFARTPPAGHAWLVLRVRIENLGGAPQSLPDIMITCDSDPTATRYTRTLVSQGIQDNGLTRDQSVEGLLFFGLPTTCDGAVVTAVSAGTVSGDVKIGRWQLR